MSHYELVAIDTDHHVRVQGRCVGSPNNVGSRWRRDEIEAGERGPKSNGTQQAEEDDRCEDVDERHEVERAMGACELGAAGMEA
jgi:hypothetical protein